jgi:hypothetical protein
MQFVSPPPPPIHIISPNIIIAKRSLTTLSLDNQVWDGHIPYFAANVTSPFSNLTIAPFFTNLVSRIRKDAFYEAPYMWTACTDPSTPVECATRWARESNQWTCDYVYSRVSNSTDLAEDGYAVGAVPIVELQISKAALRLATWLNKIVEGGRGVVVPNGQVVLGRIM